MKWRLRNLIKATSGFKPSVYHIDKVKVMMLSPVLINQIALVFYTQLSYQQHKCMNTERTEQLLAFELKQTEFN